MATRAAKPSDGNLTELQLKSFRVLTDGTVVQAMANPDGSNINSVLSSTLSGASANALTVGPNGTTNPTFNVDTNTASAATGIDVVGAAAAGGVAVKAISSGTDESLTIDAKGAGTITLNGTATGAVLTGHRLAVTSTNAAALAVGANGSTNPVLSVDASTSSVATGVKVKGAAAAGGVAVSTITSGTNENMTIDAAGSGTLTLNGTATGATNVGNGLAVTGSISATTTIKSSGATSGIGYATGAGGAVTQGTSRTTGVTLSKASGAITLVSAAGSATPFTMTVTNTVVAATDTVVVSQKSGTDAYSAVVSAVGAGSFNLTITDLTGTTTEQPVFNFAVIKAVAA